MTRRIIRTNRAPEAIGPYSQATILNGLVFCSGQIALEPGSSELVDGGIEAQTRQVMRNLEAILSEAESGFGNVLKCTIFLADMEDFPLVNTVYGDYFPAEPPARETVAVRSLPKGALVEISCIAWSEGEK